MSYSFSKIDSHGNTVSLWSPVTSGDYAKDCEKGRKYADEVVNEMREAGNTGLLGWVVRGFGQDKSRHGVEVGFTQRIAEYALS